MKKLAKINYFFLFALILYIPFYRFAQAILEGRGMSPSASFWIAHWYEPVLLLLSLVSFIAKILQKRTSVLDWLLFVITVIALLSSMVILKDVPRVLEGFRFALLPFMVFFISDFSNSKKQKNSLINLYLLVALLASVWAIAERFLPPHYLTQSGLVGSGDNYWYGSHAVSGILQSTSFIGGPNQLGSYLLPALCLSAFYALRNKKLYMISSVIILIALTFSFSRSAWAGAMIAILGMLFFEIKNKWARIFIPSACSLLILFSGFYIFGLKSNVQDLVTHGASNPSHYQALTDSVAGLIARTHDLPVLFLGTGLGSAGPLVLKYGGGILPESWFFQILFETGVLGFVLILLLMSKILLGLASANRGLFWGFLSLLVCTIFLHTLSDNPAISFSFFALAGACYEKKI